MSSPPAGDYDADRALVQFLRAQHERLSAERTAAMVDAQSQISRLATMVRTPGVDNPSGTPPMKFAAHAYRYKGRLVPLTERVVRLGERGGLYELRQVQGAPAGVLQRVSLVARDQKRCLNGVLRGAKGVCGYIENDTARTNQTFTLTNKHYGGFKLKERAPMWLREWVERDQLAARQHEMPVPYPPDTTTVRKRARA